MSKTGEYDDIIDLSHHVSSTRKPMSMEARASQFAPFAALTGHDVAIRETARLTDARIEKSEDELLLLSQKFNAVLETGKKRVNISYFRPDGRKDGGAYVSEQLEFRRFAEAMRQLNNSDGRILPLDDIEDISLV
ncbi:MAG: hypothetical protein K2M06_05690 [Muribaculaceae bacterium]|nr:hypothetical protein [Muribaculaceae bacterium]